MDSVRTPEERFAHLPGYPFAPRHADLPDGLRMAYVEEGPADAEVVLLLHGQPTWSYLYRTVVRRLAEHGLRAVAPDLIGFGRSDKPVARTAHSVQAHIDWLSHFVDAVGLVGVTLVVQDWGGPIGLGLLHTHPRTGAPDRRRQHRVAHGRGRSGRPPDVGLSRQRGRHGHGGASSCSTTSA